MKHHNDEAEIRGLIEATAQALRQKDATGASAHNAPDLRRFDIAPPLQTTGTDLEGLKAWFGTWQSGIGYETRDIDVTTSGDLAVCHGFVRISGTKLDGERPEVWARQTLCFRRQDASWRLFHEHTSVPFYMDGSLRAAVDLKP